MKPNLLKIITLTLNNKNFKEERNILLELVHTDLKKRLIEKYNIDTLYLENDISLVNDESEVFYTILLNKSSLSEMHLRKKIKKDDFKKIGAKLLSNELIDFLDYFYELDENSIEAEYNLNSNNRESFVLKRLSKKLNDYYKNKHEQDNLFHGKNGSIQKNLNFKSKIYENEFIEFQARINDEDIKQITRICYRKVFDVNRKLTYYQLKNKYEIVSALGDYFWQSLINSLWNELDSIDRKIIFYEPEEVLINSLGNRIDMVKKNYVVYVTDFIDEFIFKFENLLNEKLVTNENRIGLNTEKIQIQNNFNDLKTSFILNVHSFIEKIYTNNKSSLLTEEIYHHAKLCDSYVINILPPKKQLLAKIDDFCFKSEKQLFVIKGTRCSGKSRLIASLAHHLKNEDNLTLIRFCGTTKKSSQLISLWQSILNELQITLGLTNTKYTNIIDILTEISRIASKTANPAL